MEWIIEALKQAWEDASQNEFFQGGFLLGILTWIGYQLKSVPQDIWSRIDRRIRYVAYLDNKTDMYKAFTSWYIGHYPEKFKKVEAMLRDHWEDDKSVYSLWLRQFEDLNWIFRNRRLIIVTKDREKMEGARDITNSYIESYRISGLFAKNAINAMLKEAEENYNAQQQQESGVRVIIKDEWYDNVNRFLTSYKRVDQIYCDELPPLMADIDEFLTKKEDYNKRGRVFKRSYLLYGPPGTGKTSILFALADHYKRPVYYVNPSSFSEDAQFSDFFAKVKDDSIVIIEDVDIFFTDRDSVREDKDMAVSFSTLLNVLDGLHSPENVLIFMTTNREQLLDEAFIRKGRLDYKVCIDYASTASVEGFIKNYFEVPDFDLCEALGRPYSEVLPMVDIQDACDVSDSVTSATELILNEIIKRERSV